MLLRLEYVDDTRPEVIFVLANRGGLKYSHELLARSWFWRPVAGHESGSSKRKCT